MTIVAPLDGEVIGPTWTAAVTDAVNALVAAIPADAADSTVVDGSTTSTSYVNSLTTTTTRGVAFTAPASGIVLISGSTAGRNGTAGQASYIDFEIRVGSTIGSGTVFRPSNDNRAGSFQSDSIGQQGTIAITPTVVSGLTPGTVYHVVLTYKVSAGTGIYNRRSVTVDAR